MKVQEVIDTLKEIGWALTEDVRERLLTDEETLSIERAAEEHPEGFPNR